MTTSEGDAASVKGLEHGVFAEGRAARRLRVYIGEGDKWKGRPLYEAIVRAARAAHMAGATVFRGPMGFGASSVVHTAKILRLSEDLPIVVEVVDAPEKIGAFRVELDEMMGRGAGGLVTVEDVGVLLYAPGEGG